MDVALVTHEGLPGLADDDRLLLPALARRGIRAHPAVWSDPRVDWARFDVAVLRSTWDYHLRREEFLAWVDRASTGTDLWNPPALVRWNSHKSYLRDLSERGVRVVPTDWPPSTSSLGEVLDRRGWDRAVVKPAVSAAAHRTFRVDRSSAAEGEAAFRALRTEGEVLVQPYLPSVEDPGEHSLIHIDGTFSHAVDRVAALATGRGPRGGQLVSASDEERRFARDVLRLAPRPTLYARVDLARDQDRAVCLMELEVLEPSLFLDVEPMAPERFAAAIERRVRERMTSQGT